MFTKHVALNFDLSCTIIGARDTQSTETIVIPAFDSREVQIEELNPSFSKKL